MKIFTLLQSQASRKKPASQRNRNSLFQHIVKDEAGFVISVELVLVGVVALIGLVAGLASVRDAMVSELSDLAGSFQDCNQSFEFLGVVGHSAASGGAGYTDASDHCDDADDAAGSADNCITFDASASGSNPASFTSYNNSDNTTDISASQNDTTIKWELEPGQDRDADAVTQAIIDCIKGGNIADITWTDVNGNTNTFSADTIVADGPSGFAFTGSSSGSASGKLSSATVSCADDSGSDGGFSE